MKTLPPRFWVKVRSAPVEECWIWQAARSADGYGNFKLDGRARKAHRLAYEELVADIPTGLDIDHLCRNRACVNPWHMEPVTRRINTLRGEGWCAEMARKTACGNGHPFNVENTRYNSAGRRACRVCNRRAVARYREAVLR